MKIAFISSEVVPFSKTGGLADVSGALPKYLAELGHDVTVFTPLYRGIRRKFRPKKVSRSLSVPVGSDKVSGTLYEGKLPDSKVTVYFLSNKSLFEREGLYGDSGGDYRDNCSRFVFFSRGVLEAIEALGMKVDVLHSNDWQSSLVPVYCRIGYGSDNAVSQAANVFTIHNMAYQGLFWHWDIPLTNVGWEHFNYKELEFYGKVNFLKGGIVFSDAVTTVSPTYAKEIQGNEELGAGLHGVLSDRSENLFGIINGIDYSTWNPEKDKLIPKRYSADNLSGKAACKKALQKEAGLTPAGGVPLVGVISRLADQKGLDLVAEIIDVIMDEDLQFVLLGTGLEKYHRLFEKVAADYPGKAGIFLKFDNRLAHLIEAGADMFLMPSRYEPCGLNQMISLKYGTVPVVRATGGLADTITNANGKTEQAGKANGFSFKPYDARELTRALKRALGAYRDRKRWSAIVATGMRQDWSWSRSAGEYVKVYERTIAAKRKSVETGGKVSAPA
ncbi:MAG: glycogen synthase GlgA [Planctomycetota bacterium]|jgi:starch synthase